MPDGQRKREKKWETALQSPRSVKKEGEEVLQLLEQRFPCSPWWRPWWHRLSPCSPWRSMVEQISTCSPWRPPQWSSWYALKEAAAHAESYTGADISWMTAAHGRTHAGSEEKSEGEEGAAEWSWYGLTAAPILHCPAPLDRRGEKSNALERRLGKEGERESCWFNFCLWFSLLKSILIFPTLCVFCPWW